MISESNVDNDRAKGRYVILYEQQGHKRRIGLSPEGRAVLCCFFLQRAFSVTMDTESKEAYRVLRLSSPAFLKVLLS